MPGEAPITREATAYSEARTLRVGPRATRLKTGTVATTIVITTPEMPGPKTAAIRIASNSVGNANSMSVMRMKISSSRPPV